tara:strand:+ start:576 stop:1115 length:540 start_codon:yes stop_codon:yes gene_type:complete
MTKYVHVQLPDGTYGQRGSLSKDYKYAIVREGYTTADALLLFEDRIVENKAAFNTAMERKQAYLDDCKAQGKSPDQEQIDLYDSRAKFNEDSWVKWSNYRQMLLYALKPSDGQPSEVEWAWEVFKDLPKDWYLTLVRPEVLGWSQTNRNAYKRQATEANRGRDRVLVLDAIPGKAPKAT